VRAASGLLFDLDNAPFPAKNRDIEDDARANSDLVVWLKTVRPYACSSERPGAKLQHCAEYPMLAGDDRSSDGHKL
jgi:hypothetical protein